MTTPKTVELVGRVLSLLQPQEDLLLADWMTKNITLPEGKAAHGSIPRASAIEIKDLEMKWLTQPLSADP
jgi:hypothetical protein